MRRAAAIVLAAGLLAGCSDPAPAPIDTIEVVGEIGSVPVATFDTPLDLAQTDHRLLIEGSGTPLSEGGPVLLRTTTYDGSDGTLEAAGEFHVLTFTKEDLGDALKGALTGQAEGSRVLLVQPVEGESDKEMLVSISDVLPTRATGQSVPLPEGVPAVTLAENGEPSTDLPGADITTLRITPTMRGTGEQVMPGQNVILQYTVWQSDGSVYDSTWQSGAVPVTVQVDEVFPGLRDGLLDQRVGSQILMEVPPAEAIGSDSLVIVADILAVYDPAEPPA